MTLENYKFNYALTSNVDKSDQPIILFLHGFMGNIYEFDAVIKILSDEFDCLTLDLPGHGKTQVFGGEEYYTLVKTAQAIIELLDKLKITKCFLVGYSMGGRLALYMTLHFPERFHKVVLESTSPGLPTDAERLQRLKLDSQIARKLTRIVNQTDFATFLSNWYSQPIFGQIKNHFQYQSMLDSRLQNHPLELAQSLRFMGTGYLRSLWEDLKDNQVPLLLLTGEYDQKFIDINKAMFHRCRFAELKVISNVGHNIHFENTKEFVQNLREFLVLPGVGNRE